MINSWKNKKLYNLKNKRVVITGTTSGLGLETLKHLASLNCEIVIGVRNTQKANEQKQEILKILPETKIEILFLDLTDLNSILEFSKNVQNHFKSGFDALVNNAGIFAQPKQILNSGYEKHFFTNTLAPIILSKSLLPSLQKQPNSKIVFLGSISFNKAIINTNDIDIAKNKNNITTYANSKRWLIFYALELAKQLAEKNSKTSVTICNPGISGTSLMNPKNGTFSNILYKITSIGQKILFSSPKKASLTELFSIIAKTKNFEWISPKIFGIWGYPKISKLKIKHFNPEELTNCYNKLEEIVSKLTNVKI